MFRCCAREAISTTTKNFDADVTEHQIMKEVSVELYRDGPTHKRITKFEGDLNALRAAIFNVYDDLLVPEIAKISGKSPKDIRDPDQQKGILEQYLHVELYKEKFKDFVDVVDAADVDDGDRLRTFVRESDLLRSTGLPKGPCQLWCAVHSTGQGYFQLGGAIGNTSNGATIYEVKVDGVSSMAHEITSSVVHFEHVEGAKVATFKMFFQTDEKIYIGYKTDQEVIATTDTKNADFKFVFTFENGKYRHGYGMFWKIIWGDINEKTKKSGSTPDAAPGDENKLKTENLIAVTDKNRLHCINKVVAEWFINPACLFSISALSATGKLSEC